MRGPRLTLGIEHSRDLFGTAPAVTFGDHAFTWASFADRVARVAGALRDIGVRPGDRVCILAQNSHRYLEVMQAALWVGGVFAPMNSRFSRPEMVEVLRDCEPKVLFADAAFVVEAQAIAAAAPGTIHLVFLGDEMPPPGILRYEAALAGAEPIDDAGRNGDDLACLFYTGGTTGRAKGVMLSHANIWFNALHARQPVGLTEKTVHLHCGPLFHLGAAARVFAVTCFSGHHVVLPRFDPPDVLRAIEQHRIDTATFVPTMLNSLLASPELRERDLSSLRLITYGAAPMPETLQRRLLAELPRCGLLQAYGMTETSAVVTMLTAELHDPALGKLRSAGRVVPNVEMRIADAHDQPLARRAVGEIQVRGPTVMLGYWNQPELTAQALRDGWMHTGDAGYLDEDGFLFVVDRMKDMIVSGGENIYSAEVENAIHHHPAIAECAVFGIPDEVWGEAVHAVVVPKHGLSATPAEIVAHCRSLIAGYKCPKSVEVSADPLPRSGAGKIVKHGLRARWWDGRSRAVN